MKLLRLKQQIDILPIFMTDTSFERVHCKIQRLLSDLLVTQVEFAEFKYQINALRVNLRRQIHNYYQTLMTQYLSSGCGLTVDQKFNLQLLQNIFHSLNIFQSPFQNLL